MCFPYLKALFIPSIVLSTGYSDRVTLFPAAPVRAARSPALTANLSKSSLEAHSSNSPCAPHGKLSSASLLCSLQFKHSLYYLLHRSCLPQFAVQTLARGCSSVELQGAHRLCEGEKLSCTTLWKSRSCCRWGKSSQDDTARHVSWEACCFLFLV